MEKTIVFPSKQNQRYYNIHYLYVLNIFKYLKWNILFTDDNSFNLNDTSFACIINNTATTFDFSDSGNNLNIGKTKIFKFHYRKEHTPIKNIYPFTPVSFYNWEQYNELKKIIKYNHNIGNIITNRQRPYAGALERRNNIQKMLKNYDNIIQTNIIDQNSYWLEINNIMVSIFVPGFCNNMLDRGQLQYMAFGCCTISPKIPEILPYNENILENGHYILCKDDYSDLIEKIEWCKKNKELCLMVGKNAKKLFENTSTPEKLIDWILA